jgi:hypothetical protein
MFANLFATLPTSSPSNNALAEIFTSGSLALRAHVVIAFVLLGIALVILAISVYTKRKDLVGIAAVSLVSLAIAFYAGLQFILSGYTNNISSYLMSVGFILSVWAYFLFIARMFSRMRRISSRELAAGN